MAIGLFVFDWSWFVDLYNKYRTKCIFWCYDSTLLVYWTWWDMGIASCLCHPYWDWDVDLKASLCNHYLLKQTNDSMSLSITCKSKGHHILWLSSISGCFCVEKRHNTKFPPWYSVPCNFVVGRFASRLIRWGGRFKDDTCPHWLQVYHLSFLACYPVVSPDICFCCTTADLYLYLWFIGREVLWCYKG